MLSIFPELGSVWRSAEGLLCTVVGVEAPPTETLAYTVMVAIQATESKIGEIEVMTNPFTLTLALDDFLKEWKQGKNGAAVSKWEHILRGLQ